MNEQVLLSYIIINSIGILILLVMIFFMRRKTSYYAFEEKIFFVLLLVNIAILVFDTGMWYFNKKTFFGAYTLNLICTIFYYILNAGICLNWLLYVDCKIYKNNNIRTRLHYYAISIAIIFILTIISIFTNVIFYIDENNVYHRGKLFLLFAILSYSYLVYATILLIIKRKELKKRNFVLMLLYALPPFIASIIQTIFEGTNIIWVFSALSAVIIFAGLQSHYLNTDSLTGLYNRRQLRNYLSWRMKKKSPKVYLAGLMLDIDNFKKINEDKGNFLGDKILKDAANVLINSIGKNDFIARYAGDEFVIITETEYMDHIQDVINNIKNNTDEYNQQNDKNQKLIFSYGYIVLSLREELPEQDFFDIMDKKMYECKKDKLNVK